MKSAGQVTLEIYDFALELLIKPVNKEWRPAGDRNEIWDGHGENGSEIANGVYFYRIEGGGEERWGKVVILD
jgi:flagellar hook assembly protein FlgD